MLFRHNVLFHTPPGGLGMKEDMTNAREHYEVIVLQWGHKNQMTMWAREEGDQDLPRGFPKNSCRWIWKARFRLNYDSFNSSKYILRTAYVAGPKDRKMNEDKSLPSWTLRAFQWGRQPDKQMLGSEPGAVTCNSNLTNTYMSVHQGHRGWTVKKTNYRPWTSGHFTYTLAAPPPPGNNHSWKGSMSIAKPQTLSVPASFCLLLPVD